ncbi:MAG: alpha/beta hydrolase fold domain-containing protein [Treponema sp.]|nr:alpha/beta hydrolase fold domain-containing protein [Treponema sp.]
MSMHSNRREALKKLRLLIYSPKISVDTFRSKIEETFACPILPNRVECMESNYGGVMCDVLSPEIYSSRRILIYIHGGSFVGGSRVSWRGMCSRIAAKALCKVVVPEFRLAPTFTYPAAIEDVQSVFRSVYTELQVSCTLDEAVSSSPCKPEIVLAADSSGASIVLSLLFNLRERYKNCVTRLILLSPWLNFLQGDETKKKGDELLLPDTLSFCGGTYTYAENLSNAQVSPLQASPEMFKDFPPVYMQVGEKEFLMDEYNQFVHLLESAKVQCDLDVWKDMPPLFQLADESLWETHLALEKIGKIAAGTLEANAALYVENKPILENSSRVEA